MGLERCNCRSETKDPRHREGDTRRKTLVSTTATTVVSGRGSGRRLQLWGSRLFGAYWRSLPELCGESTAVVAAAPGAAAVTLHPAPQWILAGPRVGDSIGRRLPPLSREAAVSGWGTVGTLGERWVF